jgi:hypothetical protein
MSNLRKQVLLPTGRIVMGDLYKASDKDADGKPRIVKTGPNAGQATQQYFIAVAIKKTVAEGAHWAGEPWAATIWAVGNAAFPKIAEGPLFSWKIVDGSSAVPNKKGIAPNTREGYPGHWVISIAGTFAPKVVNEDGSAYLLEPGTVKCGDYVQALVSIDGNGSTQNPGVYVNFELVSYQGIGERIVSGPDPTAVGFGKGPKPAGVLPVPTGQMKAPAPASPPTVAAPPPVPGAAPAPAAPIPLVPSPGFLVPPPPPPAPPAPPAAGKTLTAKAGTNTYPTLIAAGWTDALLIEHGMMVGP